MMRGYFGVGVEGVGNPANVGGLFRSAHAFGASFVFTVAADYTRKMAKRADTSDAPGELPFYDFPDVDSMALPSGCRMIGVELDDDAIDLPSFRHPQQAVYVLGRERGSLTPGLVAKCDQLVRIPTRFSLNLAIAGALVMYDRVLSLGKFPARPVGFGQKPDAPERHVHGQPVFRADERRERFRAAPPDGERP